MNWWLKMMLLNILNDPLTAVILRVLKPFSVLNPLSRRLEILIVEDRAVPFNSLGMWHLLSL